MQRGVFHIAFVASLAAPAAAQPSSQPPEPAKWMIHDASDRCLATHDYKVDGQDWIVGIEPRPTSDETSLLLLAPVTAPDLRQAHVLIGGTQAASDLSLDVNDRSGRRLYRTRLTHDDLARLTANGSVQVVDLDRTVSIPVSNVGQVHQFLGSCVQTLLENWGMPADKQASVAAYPVIDRRPADYVSNQERDSIRVRPGMNANATVVVQVQSNGAANDCVVIHSTGDADLDARTCKIFVERARYRPARDRAGQPIRAPLLASLAWGRP